MKPFMGEMAQCYPMTNGRKSVSGPKSANPSRPLPGIYASVATLCAKRSVKQNRRSIRDKRSSAVFWNHFSPSCNSELPRCSSMPRRYLIWPQTSRSRSTIFPLLQGFCLFGYYLRGGNLQFAGFLQPLREHLQVLFQAGYGSPIMPKSRACRGTISTFCATHMLTRPRVCLN